MRTMRVIAALMLPVFVAACGAGVGNTDTYGQEYSSDAAVSQAVYRHDGPSRLTLMTMVSNSTGSGAHSALMINGSQRVIWDPAGTVNKKGFLEEQGDVLYGITPGVENWYKRAHARESHHVIIQEIDVSPQVAEMALQLVQARGGAGQAQCAYTTSEILSKLPGFGNIGQTWFPVTLSEQFQSVPGVRRTALYEYDDADKDKALEQWDPERFRQQMAAR